jgi:hypothetical protein
VQVLEDEKHRRLDAERIEHGPHVGEQPRLGVTAPAPVAACQGIAQVRHEPRQGRRHGLPDSERGRAQQRPERLGDRQVRDAGTDEVDAAAGEDVAALSAGPVRQFGGQPCLADAGIAGDQHRRAAPRRRLGQRRGKPLQGRRLADVRWLFYHEAILPNAAGRDHDPRRRTPPPTRT